MRLIGSILLTMFFIFAGPVEGKCNNTTNCNDDNKVHWEELPGNQLAFLQGTFFEEQDSNDIDGLDYFIINTEPEVKSFQHKGQTITVFVPITIQVNINTLLIDLPPPTLS